MSKFVTEEVASFVRELRGAGHSCAADANVSLRLNFGVVDEATNPAPALNGQFKGTGEAGLVA